jgi:putative membrane protein
MVIRSIRRNFMRKNSIVLFFTVLTVISLLSSLKGFAVKDKVYEYGPEMMQGFDYNKEDIDKSAAVQSELSKIRKEQGLKKGEPINPYKVKPGFLGELGDAVMDVIISNKNVHEWMDKKMGGEGSPSLEYMHERMGYSYLAGLPLGMGMMGWGYGPGGGYYGMPVNGSGWCPFWRYPYYSTNNINNFWRGGSMMWNYGYGPGMMGGWYGGWGGMFMGLIFLVLLILVIFFVVRGFRGGVYPSTTGETPLDILKKRYAKGEISKDDYERMKKDIS